MTKGTLDIHSENILPIIKKWLYSDKDIFLRELVSNACDALKKVKILRDKGETNAKDEEFKIQIDLDTNAKTLTISDTGIGMDAEEVKTYIAQIAFSGAEAFVEKYEKNDEKEQFIGHFGLGFYSAYMVAERVDIQSLSYKKDAQPVFWSCDGSSEYTIEEGNRTERGTSIILHIGSDDEEYLDHAKIRGILKQYCSFLPYPIFLNNERINEREPLWVKSPSECKENDYLEFYRALYPMQEDPLFWVHLNVDYPFHLKGILYFPKLKKNFDLKKQSVQLYCNRVFVSDNCKDILPEYLMPLQGIIDSPDIPLNVSRSYLQMDRTARQVAGHISKKVTDSLSTLLKTDRDKFLQTWPDTSIIIKLGAVEDDKFYDRCKSLLLWNTTKDEWLTTEEWIERFGPKTKNSIPYTADPKHNAHLIELYQNRNIDVVIANSPLDHYVMHTLEQKLDNVTFKRIDAAIDDELLDSEKDNTILDSEGRTESARIADFFRSQLDQVDVEAKSLASDSLPAIIVMDEQQRRLRDSMRAFDTEQNPNLSSFAKRTFIANTNSPLIHAVYKLKDQNPSLAKELVEELYDLSLLSQKEMEADALQEFIGRTNRILEKLAAEAVQQK